MVKKMINDWRFWGVFIYVILSILFGLVYQNGLILFLGWNMILASVVYILSYLYVDLKIKRKNIRSWTILALFILFFPNAIYITSDFIHLQVYDFFSDYASIYTYTLMDWIVFMQVTLGAFWGAKLGISALDYMKDYHVPLIKRYYPIFLGILFIASSVGIYLGRFIRLNSWNIFNMFNVVHDISEQGLFFIGFVGIYVVIHLVIYFVMKENKTKTV